MDELYSRSNLCMEIKRIEETLRIDSDQSEAIKKVMKVFQSYYLISFKGI